MADPNKIMQQWSINEVCIWLEELPVSKEIVDCFRKQEIDGYALAGLNDNNIKEICSSISYGSKFKILSKRDELFRSSQLDNASIQNNSAQNILLLPGLQAEDGSMRACIRQVSELNCTSNTNLFDETSLKQVAENISLATPKQEETHGEITHVKEHYTNFSQTLEKDEQLFAAKSFDKKEKLKNVVLPIRRTLSIEAKTTCTEERDSSERSINLRKFGLISSSTLTYREGAIAEETNFRPISPMEVVHRFYLIDLSTGDFKELLDMFTEIIRFTSACILAATNGTIHFGIAPNHGNNCRKGQIIGTLLYKDAGYYETEIQRTLRLAFGEERYYLISKMVKSIQLIPVCSDQQAIANKFVIEIDILPSSDICDMDTPVFIAHNLVVNNSIFSVDTSENVFCFDDQSIKLVNTTSELIKLSDIFQRNKLARKNAQDDAIQHHYKRANVDLKKELIWHMCLGEEKLKGDIYPVLVINKPSKKVDIPFIKENFQFISAIKWKAIFDFDNMATICDLMQEEMNAQIIATCDDLDSKFCRSVKHEEKCRKLYENIQSSGQPSWIFVNGYKTLHSPCSLMDWKRNKRNGFREAVRIFFEQMIPKGREIVVFLMLSDDTDILIECDEFISNYQWLCINESEDDMDIFSKQLIRRNSISNTDEVKGRFIAGMPWSHVQIVMNDIAKTFPVYERRLPTSLGVFITLKESFRNELNDLEILSSNECDHEENDVRSNYVFDQRELEYYKGSEVTWWNFWCSTHVLERDINQDLRNFVDTALKSGMADDNLIAPVFLYHQPGAGATTCAKQLLWDHRKSYRCAIVRRLTDQTVDQIIKFYSYEERNEAKPILLLFDKHEEDQIDSLLKELNQKAKRLAREIDRIKMIFCVCIICISRSTIPKNIDAKMSFKLCQDLSPKELRAFKEKFEKLEKDINSSKSSIDPQYDPKLLISLNIMKSNFSKEAIESLVVKNIDGMQSADEMQLLKLIALINNFDIHFTYLPTAAFDTIMTNTSNYSEDIVSSQIPKGQRYKKRWETCMSSELRTLTNQATTVSFGDIKSIRLAHPLLSSIVLDIILKRQNTSIYDLASDLLTSGISFNNAAERKLLEVIKNILKKRKVDANGRSELFSPLVDELRTKSVDQAATILRLGFEKTSDVFIAQQLARLYITAENWSDALLYAEKAVELNKQSNKQSSFLADTVGRVYLKQLQKEYIYLMSGGEASSQKAVEMIKLAQNAFTMFKKTQELAEENCYFSSSNDAGYFGEIQTIILLLDCMNYTQDFCDKNKLKKFLLDDDASLPCWEDDNGENVAQTMKELAKNVLHTMTRIEDEKSQLFNETFMETTYHRRNTVSGKYICKLRLNLLSYFGEESDDAPAKFTLKQQCEYRRRRMHSLGGNSFSWSLENNGSQIDNINRIINLAKKNIDTIYRSGEDYRCLISAYFILQELNASILLSYDIMVEWSIKLYQNRANVPNRLEPYLFYCMLRWPRPNISIKNFATPQELADTLSKWKEVYYNKHPLQKSETNPHRKKDKTVYYFANGENLESIISFKSCAAKMKREQRSNDANAFWSNSHTKAIVQRFEGTLCSDGEEVQAQLRYPSGNIDVFRIPASFPISNTGMWNKNVYFAIGFTWLGPKAFDISLEKPLNYSSQVGKPKTVNASLHHDSTMASTTTNTTTLTQNTKLSPRYTLSTSLCISSEKSDGAKIKNTKQIITHDDFSRELTRIKKKLSEIQLCKGKIARKEKLTTSEVNKYVFA